MKLPAVLLAMTVISLPLNSQTGQTRNRRLKAPTYYIVIDGRLRDSGTIVVRGALSLPPGSEVSTQAGDGTKFVTERKCATVGEDGLFSQELHPSNGGTFKWSPQLSIDATFLTTGCRQPIKVLQIVGKHGQYLGNDNYDNKIDIHVQMTPGMDKNPQLFQVSGWFFGLTTSVRVSQ